jgi:ATP-dependent RNA helicase HelY
LIFVFSRRLVEEMAETMASKFRLLDENAESYVRKRSRDLPQSVHDIHGKLVRCLPHGIGFHHAGLLPAAKAAVEGLFLHGYLPVVFCTETFALGVNFPARTVVFAATTKRGDEGFRPLTAREMLQISGRAGRRGIDTRGYAYILVNPDYPWEVPLLPPEEPEPLAPELVLTHEGVLRLVLRLGVAGETAIREYFRKGFSAYRTRGRLLSVSKDIDTLKERRISLLEAEGCPGIDDECAEKIARKQRSILNQIGQWEKMSTLARKRLGGRRDKKARATLETAEHHLAVLRNQFQDLPETKKCPGQAEVSNKGRCPVFSQVTSLEKKIRRLQSKIDAMDVAKEAWRQFLKSRNALEKAGFIDNLSLTDKGRLALSCGPGGVLFAEILTRDQGLETGIEQIAGYAAGSLCEDEDKSSPVRRLPIPVMEAVKFLRSRGLAVLYSNQDALSVRSWASGDDVLTASLAGEMAPGDFVMLARRAAETLRGASTAAPCPVAMRGVLEDAVKRVWRDEVSEVL